MKDEFLGLKKNKKFPDRLKNQKGQFAIEAVLLMTVLIGAFLALTQFAKKEQFVQKLVQKPMERVGRMAAYGTWNEGCSAPGKPKLTTGKCHPNSIARSLSSDPN